MDIKETIKKVTSFIDLTEQEMIDVFEAIMSGNATDSQIGAFITALKMKNETVNEITGAARVMREKAVRIAPKCGPLLDTCGTGGSGKDIFNVSTVSAFVIASCGAKVAKHGNRAVSSSCGSADLLEQLGVNISITPQQTEKCIEDLGVGFMFAPLYHSSMKYAAGPRKELGVRTIFNILGPLSNPASADFHILGVYDEGLLYSMAEVLGRLGVKRAYIVHSLDGLDEASVTDITKITELKNGELENFQVRPEDFGVNTQPIETIKGGSKEENARIALSILNNEDSPYKDMVLINSSLSLVLTGIAKDITEGADMVIDSLATGKANDKLDEFIKATNQEAL